MQKNPYLTLGINDNATFSEISDAYNELKGKYSEERFLEGEAGANAAKKLAEIEVAYNECMEDLNNRAHINDGEKYTDVGSLIKDGKLNDAQAALDKYQFRDAEWHYYQSIIYYKKDWLGESKKQLEIAITLDPSNSKYKESNDKMDAVLKGKSGVNAQGQQPNMNETRAGYGQPNPNARAGTNACCDTCCALACLDSCCECCGGDCISCC